MSNLLLVLGFLLVGYTVIAFFTGLPQLTDFMPVGNSEEGFYKIVPSDKPDYGAWYVLGGGVALVVMGALIKYVFNG